ncbi:MAG: hypothetical protein WC729_07650 [Sphingomonas sp.]|jgi:hypothetical protein|uniref:hypothetical protein n=1 Tax=Sphingomonas sp. TaxID=28214 RepID=UPI003569E64A
MLSAMVLPGQSPACTLPAGFVDTPRPDIAPLDALLGHVEEIHVARPFAAPARNRPLEEAIRPTRDLPGVAGTLRLSATGYGSVGSRRLVCLTDGSTAVEEVLLTEAGADSRRFRYMVWNYTSPKFRDVEYAVGDIFSTKAASGMTHVTWTYRFAPKKGLDAGERDGLRKTFIEKHFAEWMRSQLERGRSHAEAEPG